MLDIKVIRKDLEGVRRAIMRRGETGEAVEKAFLLDKKRRSLIAEIEKRRSKRNSVSKRIGKEGRKPTEQEAEDIRALGKSLKLLEVEAESIEQQFKTVMLAIPNIPLANVPDGLDESGNQVGKAFGHPVDAPNAVPHWDFGVNKLQVLDIEAAARMSGARFYLLKGPGARLNRALASWMLDVHSMEFGYTEIEPPLLVRKETMMASGNLPKFASNLYKDEETDLWLIPTSEVSLNAIHAGKIIPSGKLPLKYVAQTTCFRKEKTASGRDVRGIKRVHQFEKVEMFRFSEPHASEEAFEEMLEEACTLCERLDLIYRVVRLCAGDMGFQAAKTLDIEVWSPGVEEWLEVSSISNCLDFQARRSNTRYRPAPNTTPCLPHTLNGSGLALPRIWIAVLESGIQSDGSVVLPKPLHRYVGSDRLTPPE